MPQARRRSWIERVRRVLRRPPQDLFLLGNAWLRLGRARWRIRRRGLQAVAESLGERMWSEPDQILPAPDREQIARISWAVAGAGTITPWTSNCFPQAVAASELLARRNLPSTTFFGVSLDRVESRVDDSLGSAFAAHAWTSCGDVIVTGENQRNDHRPIVWFGKPNCGSRAQ